MVAAAGFGGLWFTMGPRLAMTVVAVAVVVVVPLALTAVLKLERSMVEA